MAAVPSRSFSSVLSVTRVGGFVDHSQPDGSEYPSRFRDLLGRRAERLDASDVLFNGNRRTLRRDLGFDPADDRANFSARRPLGSDVLNDGPLADRGLLADRHRHLDRVVGTRAAALVGVRSGF